MFPPASRDANRLLPSWRSPGLVLDGDVLARITINAYGHMLLSLPPLELHCPRARRPRSTPRPPARQRHNAANLKPRPTRRSTPDTRRATTNTREHYKAPRPIHSPTFFDDHQATLFSGHRHACVASSWSSFLAHDPGREKLSQGSDRSTGVRPPRWAGFAQRPVWRGQYVAQTP
jgi:hypothetical protein